MIEDTLFLLRVIISYSFTGKYLTFAPFLMLQNVMISFAYKVFFVFPYSLIIKHELFSFPMSTYSVSMA
jgi:hypothetical protein